MRLQPISTPLVYPRDNLEKILNTLPELKEGDVIAVTSKIISLCEGRIIPSAEENLAHLIREEADAIWPIPGLPETYLTLIHHTLLGNAGIDHSNVPGGGALLLPKDPMASAEHIWRFLRQERALSKFGVIITDSRSTPLRKGITGVALAWCGFSPLRSYVGKPDLVGQPMRVSQVNLVDGLAAAAVLVMGEGQEQTPLCLIEEIDLTFEEAPPSQSVREVFFIKREEDMYLRAFLGKDMPT